MQEYTELPSPGPDERREGLRVGIIHSIIPADLEKKERKEI